MHFPGETTARTQCVEARAELKHCNVNCSHEVATRAPRRPPSPGASGRHPPRACGTRDTRDMLPLGTSGAENVSTSFSKAISTLLLCNSPELHLKAVGGGGVYVRDIAKHTWKSGNTTNKFLPFVAETNKFSNSQFKAEESHIAWCYLAPTEGFCQSVFCCYSFSTTFSHFQVLIQSKYKSN